MSSGVILGPRNESKCEPAHESICQPQRLACGTWPPASKNQTWGPRKTAACHERARSPRPATLRLSCSWRVRVQIHRAGVRLPARTTRAPPLASLSWEITSCSMAESIRTQSQPWRGDFTFGIDHREGGRVARAGSAPWSNGKREHTASCPDLLPPCSCNHHHCHAPGARQVAGHICTNCPRARQQSDITRGHNRSRPGQRAGGRSAVAWRGAATAVKRRPDP